MKSHSLFGHRFEPQTLRGVHCPKCGGEIWASRSCLEVNLRCTSCGAEFGLQDIADQMDDSLEEALALVPMDRL